jgi:hypothetical protein
MGTLMQQGKFDEADEVMDEIDKMEQSNPELAALNNTEQARADSISASDKAEEDMIEATGNKQMGEALWPTAVEYIKAVAQEDYYTLIVIDKVLTGYQKDYSSDRNLFVADAAGMVHWDDSNWGISYPRSNVGSAAAVTSEPPAPEEKKEEGVTEKAKGFLKKLKNPF